MAGAERADSSEGGEVNDGFCSECYGIGRGKLEKRDVAGFREIIVRAFECEDCGFKSDEVQLAGQYDSQGVRLRLVVPLGDAATLGRQVLKSDTATISVPELEFEIGAGSYVPFAGNLTTVADVLMQACKNLNMNQAERRAADADTAGKIDAFIQELEEYAAGQHAFTFEIEDPAGNSFISGADGSPANAASGDPQLTVERFDRTPAQESRMGLAMPDEFLPYDGAEEAAAAPASAPGRLILRVEGQAEADAFLAAYAVEQPSAEPQQPPSGAQLPSACTACGATAVGGFEAAARQPVESFIRSCFIVSAACSSCSARAVEVRSSGGVSAQGSRLRLRVQEPADLERAVLQSASASVAVPELELALSTGSNAGMATTVGQLIGNLAEQLGNNPALAPGGTAHAEGAEEERAEWASFLASLLAFSKLERPWTLELTDPLDSSFIAAPAGVEEGQDKRLTRVMYDRPPDENEHFGLAAGGAAAPIA